VKRGGRKRPAASRFYLDEDIPYTTVEAGAPMGLDIVAARDVQPNLPQDDPVHLATAARDRRIMVTYNRDDFIVATRDAFAIGDPHAGLLILTNRLPRDAGRIARGLARWMEKRRAGGAWPMQDYEVDFLSY
jgi:predicted nuclease of predicted toxin-antitoxin system